MATFHILGLNNHTTGKTFNVWLYDNETSGLKTFKYEIWNYKGACIFADIWEVNENDTDPELAKILKQVAEDFSK